ncbi:MAG: hypothetical protein OEN56_05275 [Gemmatimonadota bacterium]|nr:hypothetical protein [Gemmatimonadota bacterium]
MTPRYRQVEPSRSEIFGAAAVSIAIGAGAAAVAFYVTRLMLSRDPLPTEPDPVAESPHPTPLAGSPARGPVLPGAGATPGRER